MKNLRGDCPSDGVAIESPRGECRRAQLQRRASPSNCGKWDPKLRVWPDQVTSELSWTLRAPRPNLSSTGSSQEDTMCTTSSKAIAAIAAAAAWFYGAQPTLAQDASDERFGRVHFSTS